MKKILLIFLACITFLYLVLIFILPPIASSDKVANTTTGIISKILDNYISLDDFSLNISPYIDSDIKFKHLIIKDKKGNTGLEIKDFYVEIDNINLKKIEAKYINVNIDVLADSFSKKTDKNKKENIKFNIKNLPNIKIDKL